MESYQVKKFSTKCDIIDVCAPASKSILNRAIVLAAISKGTVTLLCGDYADDTRALLNCLHALGIYTETNEKSILIHGCGGNIPNRNATLDVESAGTAARFLTPVLAFCGGNYTMTASPQMQKRPMEIIGALQDLGVRFVFSGERNHFPFRMISEGISADGIDVPTDISTQYASGILLSCGVLKKSFTVRLTGSRTDGSYIGMTLSLLADFGIRYERNGNEITVYPAQNTPPKEYRIEPDISGACYFYALSLLLKTKTLVRRVNLNTLQGDARLFDLLKEKGVRFTQTESGLLADGSGISHYTGFDANLQDFSDQALTVAVLAAFASTPSVLRGIGHIRYQECDRICAICENLNELGVKAKSDGDSIQIVPAPVKGGTVKTYGDHRVAMAFALAGLKTGNVIIENPDCCKKTFGNFFDLIAELTE